MFNVLLQVLDESRLTDSKGRTVNFKNTIIIMTSNLGSHLIEEQLAKDFSSDESMGEADARLKTQLNQMLRQTIRPEFLSRVDDVILFKTLTRDQIKQIVDLQLRRVNELAVRKEITLEFTEDAKEWLAKLGFDQ